MLHRHRGDVRAGDESVKCSCEGCPKPKYSKGFCKTHYNRQWEGRALNHGDFDQKFNSRFKVVGECWVWTGAMFVSGYGRIQRDGKRIRAHRASYELHVRPIPKGLHVLHKCDNPPCVNPAHLFLGTHIENMIDMEAKGRAKWIKENMQRKRNAQLLVSPSAAV